MFPFLILPEKYYNEYMPKICDFFSKTNFWMENILFIMAFVLFELFLSPMVYLKTFYTLVYSTEGMFTTIYNVFRWTMGGILILIYILLRDTFTLIDILYMHDGCKAMNNIGDQDDD